LNNFNIDIRFNNSVINNSFVDNIRFDSNSVTIFNLKTVIVLICFKNFLIINPLISSNAYSLSNKAAIRRKTFIDVSNIF
jgi:hypothetical protein